MECQIASGAVMTGSQARAERANEAKAVRRRLVAHLRAGTTDLASAAMRQRADRYTDPERFALERERLFLKGPLIACLSQDLPEAGDCVVFEELDRSVLIVRGGDGAIRAFRNMCAHRATKLVRPVSESGRARLGARFSCAFHGWTYDLSGALVRVPGEQGFDGACPRGLWPVSAAEWGGLVFVRLEGDEAIDAAAFLGPFAPVIEWLELGESAPVQASALTAATNWKCALDTYGEGYHFGVLHSATIGATYVSNLSAFDLYGPHWRLAFAEREFAWLVDQPEEGWPATEYGGIHFVFPNTVVVAGGLGPGEGFARLFRLFPGAHPGTMTCRFSVYARGVSPEGFRARFADIDDAESVVTREDYDVAIGAYANLAAAPAGCEITFGRNEPALQAFHRAVAEACGVPA